MLTDSAWSKGWRILLALAALSWAACLAGYLTNPVQFHASYLVSFTYFLTIALGASFFVLLQHLTGAVWSIPLRRLMETVMASLPVAPLLFVPVVAGLPTLYEWARPELHKLGPDFRFKIIFFSPSFFLARSAVYFVVWGVIAVNLYRISLVQDRDGGLQPIRKAVMWSGPAMALLFVTVTMAAVDWLMSLEPFWYSTIFGIYVYAGGTLAFLALLILSSLAFGRAGRWKRHLTVEHYHDLGRWLFVLVVFWAYIAFSQYMLISYANLPEETAWFKHRLEGNWIWVSALLLAGNFLVPFFLLLARAAKRNLAVLASVSVLILMIHFVDLHWIVMPTVHHHGFHMHWIDFASWAAVGSAFGLTAWRMLRRRALVPAGDLRLQRAVRHQTD
ncbi:MAG: hypothetical protein ACUVXB_09900 [Bryobacteraceae bacterium]